MYLLIDWGNTRIKYLLVSNRDCLQYRILSLPIEHASSVDEFIESVLGSAKKQAIDAVLITSVRDAKETKILAQKLNCLGGALFIARTAAMSCGVKCAYTNYKQLGVDRWLAVIGAHDKQQNVGIIDAGSALTVDLVSSNGVHLGGHILAGKQLLRDSLLKTAQVRANKKVSVSSGFKLGRSTSECVDFGIEQMTDAYLNSVIQQAKALQSIENWIITGGDGYVLFERLSKSQTNFSSVRFDYQPNIVFKGLADLYIESVAS